jgi:hypothetical protein
MPLKKRYKFSLLLFLVSVVGVGFYLLKYEYGWAFADESYNQAIARLEQPINARFEKLQSLVDNLPKREDIPKHLVDNTDTIQFDPPLIYGEDQKYNFTLDSLYWLRPKPPKTDFYYSMRGFQKTPNSIHSMYYILHRIKKEPWYVRGCRATYRAESWQNTLDTPYAIILRTTDFTKPEILEERGVYSTGGYEVEVFVYDMRDGGLKSFSVITCIETITPIPKGKGAALVSTYELDDKLGETFHKEFVNRFKLVLK